MPLAIHLDRAIVEGTALTGDLLDPQKFFYTIARQQLFELAAECGVPAYFLRAWKSWYAQLTRHWRIGKAYRPGRCSATGLLQGCAMSMWGINLRQSLWASSVSFWFPSVGLSLYIDDRGMYSGTAT